MVCDSCQSKQSSLCVPDRGNPNRGATTSGAIKKTNKALALKSSGAWIPENQSCKVCKVKTMKNYKYCNNCAHKKGKCACCGKKTVDTTAHKMSLK